MSETLKPQYICTTCKTVIGPVWGDENQCKCCDVYDYEVHRVSCADSHDELKAITQKAVDVLSNHLQPDSPSDRETLTELYKILDNKQIVKLLETK